MSKGASASRACDEETEQMYSEHLSVQSIFGQTTAFLSFT